MKVFFDNQITTGQRFGGISRYYYDLIRTIEKENLAECYIPKLFNTNEYFDQYFNITNVDRSAVKNYGKIINALRFRAKRLISIIYCIFKINGSYDVLCPTYYYDCSIAKFAKRKGLKIVTVVYDMTHEKHPEFFGRGGEFIVRNKQKYIELSDLIIAISENTKKDIIELFPTIDSNKVKVVYIGCKMPADRVRKTTSGKTVLFLGPRGGYKNFDNLYEAMIPILRDDKEVKLLCVGGSSDFSQDEKRRFAEFSKQIIFGGCSDENIVDAYLTADCFVYPSKYEGFGMPPVEAMTLGCPVIASNSSSIPEVCGNAAVYFDPNSISEIETQIRSVLYNDELKESLRTRGYLRSKEFKWEDIARDFISLLE